MCTRFFLVLGFCRFLSSAKGKTKKSANGNSHYIRRIVGKTLINELMLESCTSGRIGCVVCFSPLFFLAKTSSHTITDRSSNSHKILLVAEGLKAFDVKNCKDFIPQQLVQLFCWYIVQFIGFNLSDTSDNIFRISTSCGKSPYTNSLKVEK